MTTQPDWGKPPGFNLALQILDSYIADLEARVKQDQKVFDADAGFDREGVIPSAQLGETDYQNMIADQNRLARLRLYRQWVLLNPDKLDPSGFLAAP